MPELTEDRCMIFDRYVQRCPGWSFVAFWLALYPDYVVMVDEQVVVEEFQSLTVIRLKIAGP